MKVAFSIVVAVVMPFGFFVLAGVIVSRMLAKRRQRQTLIAKPTSTLLLAAASR